MQPDRQCSRLRHDVAGRDVTFSDPLIHHDNVRWLACLHAVGSGIKLKVCVVARVAVGVTAIFECGDDRAGKCFCCPGRVRRASSCSCARRQSASAQVRRSCRPRSMHVFRAYPLSGKCAPYFIPVKEAITGRRAAAPCKNSGLPGLAEDHLVSVAFGVSPPFLRSMAGNTVASSGYVFLRIALANRQLPDQAKVAVW
jgi:hypothetical protein